MTPDPPGGGPPAKSIAECLEDAEQAHEASDNQYISDLAACNLSDQACKDAARQAHTARRVAIEATLQDCLDHSPGGGHNP